jgi:hypothetical protein
MVGVVGCAGVPGHIGHVAAGKRRPSMGALDPDAQRQVHPVYRDLLALPGPR